MAVDPRVEAFVRQRQWRMLSDTFWQWQVCLRLEFFLFAHDVQEYASFIQ